MILRRFFYIVYPGGLLPAMINCCLSSVLPAA